MTLAGSGLSVFGIFHTEKGCRKAKKALEKYDVDLFITYTIG